MIEAAKRWHANYLFFLKNMGANTTNQVVTILGQIFLAPFFIAAWGAETYGVWLSLVSIPLLLAYTDLGVGTVFSNQLVLEKCADKASAVFWTGLLTQGGLGVGLLCVFVAVASLWLGGKTDQLIVVSLMALYAVIGMVNTYLVNCSRYYGKNHQYIMWSAAQRLMEMLAVLISLASGLAETNIAIVYLLTRALGAIWVYGVLQRESYRLKFKSGAFSRDLLVSLLPMSLSFVLYPISLALGIQLPVLLIADQFGGVAAALFAMSRTLARIPVQFSNIVSISMWPVLTRLFASGDERKMRAMERLGGVSVLLFSTVFVLAISVVGESLFRIWSHGELSFNAGVFLLLSLQALFAAVWMSQATRYFAINNHSFISIVIAVVTLGSLFLAYLCRSFGLYGIILPLVVGDFFILFFLLFGHRRLVGYSL